MWSAMSFKPVHWLHLVWEQLPHFEGLVVEVVVLVHLHWSRICTRKSAYVLDHTTFLPPNSR